MPILPRNQAEMNKKEKEVFKERRRATAKKSYLKCVFTFVCRYRFLATLDYRNREAILKKADSKRWR